MKSKVPSPYVHSLCASSISKRTFGGTLYGSACQSRFVRNGRKKKTTRTIPAVLAKDLSVLLSATFSYEGGVGIITGSDNLDRVRVSAVRIMYM